MCVHVAAADILKPQCDVCTGRRSPAKETGFGSLPDLLTGNERSGVNRISHPDWVKLTVELNLRAKPKYEIFLFSTVFYSSPDKPYQIFLVVWCICTDCRIDYFYYLLIFDRGGICIAVWQRLYIHLYIYHYAINRTI